MPASTEQPVGIPAVLIMSGAVFFLLLGLVIWQPKAVIWIADAVDAERSVQPQDQVAPVMLAAEPKRRPIDPGEWVHLFKAENVVRESGR
jgi:hypothetical protein